MLWTNNKGENAENMVKQFYQLYLDCYNGITYWINVATRLLLRKIFFGQVFRPWGRVLSGYFARHFGYPWQPCWFTATALERASFPPVIMATTSGGPNIGTPGTSQSPHTTTAQRKKDGSPSARYWESHDSLVQLETVRQWIGKHYKKVRELTLA